MLTHPVTDNPTWVDLLTTVDAIKQSNISMESKLLHSIASVLDALLMFAVTVTVIQRFSRLVCAVYKSVLFFLGLYCLLFCSLTFYFRPAYFFTSDDSLVSVLPYREAQI